MNEEARKREEAYYAGTIKDDYISRKAVLDMLDKECGSCADIGYIFSLPGIEKRKTGKWEYKMVNEGVIGFRCSACGDEVLLPTPFCRNCGADMREKGENSESN